MDIFLANIYLYKVPKLAQEEIGELNGSMAIKESKNPREPTGRLSERPEAKYVINHQKQ